MSALKNGSTKTPRAGGEFDISKITTTAKKLPNRIVIHAKPGWGKTSFAAQIPDAIFLMVTDDGLRTLISSGQVQPNIAHFPEMAESLTEIGKAINQLSVHRHRHKALVIDNITGIEMIIHDMVCQKRYGGSWDKFNAYGGEQATKSAATEWDDILTKLDLLRSCGIGVFLIAHSKVVNFKNPSGPDYDRWIPSISKHSWERVNNWADIVLFGDFETTVDKIDISKNDAQTKGKASGGNHRILLTTHNAAYDAKNRHGLPEEIDCGSSAVEAWANFRTALTPGINGKSILQDN